MEGDEKNPIENPLLGKNELSEGSSESPNPHEQVSQEEEKWEGDNQGSDDTQIYINCDEDVTMEEGCWDLWSLEVDRQFAGLNE